MCVPHFLTIYLPIGRSGIPGSCTYSIFSILKRNCHIVSTVATPLYILTNSAHKCSNFSTLSPTLVISVFFKLIIFIVAILLWVDISLWVCTSLIIKGIKHLFMCVITVFNIWAPLLCIPLWLSLTVLYKSLYLTPILCSTLCVLTACLSKSLLNRLCQLVRKEAALSHWESRNPWIKSIFVFHWCQSLYVYRQLSHSKVIRVNNSMFKSG